MSFMDDSDLKEIEGLMKKVDCPEDFDFIKGGFKNPCRVEDLGLDKIMLCLQEDSSYYPFFISNRE